MVQYSLGLLGNTSSLSGLFGSQRQQQIPAVWSLCALMAFYLVFTLSILPAAPTSAFMTVFSLEPSEVNSVSCWDPNRYRYEPAIHRKGNANHQ